MNNLPDCPEKCPEKGEMCWDSSMWTGKCNGDVGPVYTELHEASDCR